jgi:pyrophosphatase PpaX
MQANYSTILFDFDGTLTSSLELWLQAFHYAFAKFGLKVTDDIIVRRCFYREFVDVVAEFNLPSSIQFGQLIREGLAIFFEEAKLFAGVQEILTNCANKNIKLAVVTSSPRIIVEKTLKNLEIDSFFQTIVTADDITNFKPHPEPVLLALERLQSKYDESLVIGDSQADMLAGQAAGIKTALFYPEVHTQFYDFQKLQETSPHFVFHHYDELEQYLFAIK